MLPEPPDRIPPVTIQRHYDFEASHFLPEVAAGHKCKRLHGHSYVLSVGITGPVQTTGKEAGMVVDFLVPDAIWEELRALIDHTCLNETVCANATVELMTPRMEYFFRHRLEPHAASRGVSWVVRATLKEGPRTSCVGPGGW